MNRMWDRLRQEDGEVHREVSKVNAHKMQNSSVEVEKWGKGSEHSPKSFLTILRYTPGKTYIKNNYFFREVFQKDFDEDDLNRLELKIETRAKIKEMLVDTKKEGQNTIVRYLSYSKGSQAQKGNVHLYDRTYISDKKIFGDQISVITVTDSIKNMSKMVVD